MRAARAAALPRVAARPGCLGLPAMPRIDGVKGGQSSIATSAGRAHLGLDVRERVRWPGRGGAAGLDRWVGERRSVALSVSITY